MGTKKLVIAGAGGFGREVFTWARQTWGFHGQWQFKGFLDDDPAIYNADLHPQPVIDTISNYTPTGEEEYFLCAIGKPALKKQLSEILLAKGLKPATLIHPTVVIGRNVSIGDGSILCPNVVLTCDITLGCFVTLNVATAVGHDSQVGDWTQTSAFCDLTGASKVGSKVFFGSRASLLPRIKVGDDAVVGAGSVVVRDVPAGQTVFGVPAVPLRLRKDAEGKMQKEEERFFNH